MDGCHFCDIASGRLSTAVVFEDALTFAFLDKHPINRGHTLVIPKEHQPNFDDLPDDADGDSETTGEGCPRRVAANESWDVAHTHVHIVPMHAYHDVTSRSVLEGRRANPSDEELSKTATLLRSA
jgi:histidine triad (HIT) family protein